MSDMMRYPYLCPVQYLYPVQSGRSAQNEVDIGVEGPHATLPGRTDQRRGDPLARHERTWSVPVAKGAAAERPEAAADRPRAPRKTAGAPRCTAPHDARTRHRGSPSHRPWQEQASVGSPNLGPAATTTHSPRKSGDR